MTIRQELTLLCTVALLPLLAVSGIGIWGLNQADPRKSDVAQMSAALRHHQMADMMHDAIRADVLAALRAKNAKEQEMGLSPRWMARPRPTGRNPRGEPSLGGFTA